MDYHRLRWIATFVFILSSALNYLDRNLLNVLAPLIKSDLSLNNEQYGWLISAFSVAYAAASIPAGWLLDRIGVTRGITIAVSIWSAACTSTGLVNSAGALAFCRAALGTGESASVPGFGKVNADYLLPEERALGAAVNGLGLSIGAILAATSIGLASRSGWRAPFVLSGLLGFLWIPLWWLITRLIPSNATAPTRTTAESGSQWALLGRPALLVLMISNLLWMSGFSLWSNWITVYLVEVHHLALQQTKSLVWIPPLVSNLGGFFGGWLSLRFIRRRDHPVIARRRAIWVSAFGCLSALGLLWAGNAAVATGFMSLSFFFILAGSVNMYALPIDIFGPARAGLAISALTCAYGVMQALISPAIGWMNDRHLYHLPVWCVAIAPLAAAAILMRLKVTDSEPA